jgi:hypothetical protein
LNFFGKESFDMVWTIVHKAKGDIGGLI